MNKKRFLSIFILLIIAVLSFTVSACTKKDNADSEQPQVEIKLNTYDLKLRLYSEYTLSVKTSGDFNVVFSSADTTIASVSESGLITALGAGKTTVSVSYKDVVKTCNVTVFETSEIPNIQFENVGFDNVVRLMPQDTFSVKPTVIYDGKTVDATISFESEDENVVTVTNEGMLTAITKGSTTVKCIATYKKWKVEKTLNIEVTSDTTIVISDYAVELYSSDIVGQETSAQLELLGVYENGEILSNQPVITWESNDQTVATVQNGLITAVGVGQTQVFASCMVNGEQITATINVKVNQPQLASVTNIRVEDGKIKWDNVDFADGYKFTANLIREDLTVTEYDITKLYGKVEFTITPYSNNELVKEGQKIKYNDTFKTADITERMLVTSPTAEGGTVTKVEGVSEDVYHVALKSNDFAMGRGGVFKVVYMTPFMESRINSQGNQPFVDVKAIVDNDYDLTEFKSMTISFWAYGYDNEVKFTLARTSANPSYEKGATVHDEQTIPMREWTRVELTVNSDIYLLNNNLYAAILASSDFYFTDVHINTIDYVDTVDHSDCAFYAGMNFVSAVNALPESMPTVNTQAFIEFESGILYAQNEFSLLTSTRLEKFNQVVKEKFKALKVDYVEYLVSTLPEKENLTYYHGETINLAYDIVESLSQIEKENIDGIEKLVQLKSEYDGKFIVVFDTYSPWMSTQSNSFKRVELGVNSYLATVEYSTDRTYYSQYGTVVKAVVAKGETSDAGDRTNNMHTLFDASKIRKLLEENPDVLEVRFAMLTAKSTLWDINKVGSTKSEERVYTSLGLTANAWTEVKITRADAMTTNGALRRASMVLDSAQTVCFTNFYLIKSNEIITPIVDCINALPQDKTQINMYDGSAIYSAFNAYDKLPEEYKSLVTNGAKLLELKEEYDKNYGVVFSTQEHSWIHDGRTGTYNATGVISMIDNADYGKVIKCEVAKKTEETNSQNYRVHFNNLKTFLSEHEEITQVKFKVYTTKTSSEYMVNGEYLRLEEGTWTEITLTREKVMAKESQTLSIGSFTSTAEQTLIFTNFYFVKTAN